MRIVKVNRYRVGKRVLAEALTILESGGVVVHPTESSYGLAVDPANPAALERLFALKVRPGDKSVPLVAASLEQACRHVSLSSALLRLAQRHWPGPLTLIGPARSDLQVGPERSDEVAMRVPSSVWLRALSAGLGRPITSTSANLSGQPAAYSARAVRQAFLGTELQPDLLLDAGLLPSRLPSTLVRDSGGRLELLRVGPVRIE